MPDEDRLTRLETLLEQSHAQLVAVRGIVESLAMRFASFEHRLTRVEHTVAAIKDLLDRGNGH
jgi:hypothetical protein